VAPFSTFVDRKKFRSNPSRIKQFLKDLATSPSEPWNQVKVILCGRESMLLSLKQEEWFEKPRIEWFFFFALCLGVGKTHLSHRLRGKDYLIDDSTDGINVEVASTQGKRLNQINLCIYDLGGASTFFFGLIWPFSLHLLILLIFSLLFSGQDVFYPTHQFFTTSKAIYLVVYDLTQPKDKRIEYWSAFRSICPTCTVALIIDSEQASNITISSENHTSCDSCWNPHRSNKVWNGGELAI